MIGYKSLPTSTFVCLLSACGQWKMQI